MTKEQVDIELAAHGHGVVEIRRDDATGTWSVVEDSPYNRRITALATECRISGPAAGHDRLKTNGDPTGTKVVGTLNNCAGGKTPWGTVLIAEENFQRYFAGDPEKTPEARNLEALRLQARRASTPGRGSTTASTWTRTRTSRTSSAGWSRSIPMIRQSVPVKRTALGRFRHEGATTVVNKDGRVVVYSGDDERFDYVYRFVTDGRFDRTNRDANRDLLD